MNRIFSFGVHHYPYSDLTPHVDRSIMWRVMIGVKFSPITHQFKWNICIYKYFYFVLFWGKYLFIYLLLKGSDGFGSSHLSEWSSWRWRRDGARGRPPIRPFLPRRLVSSRSSPRFSSPQTHSPALNQWVFFLCSNSFVLSIAGFVDGSKP